MKSIGEQLAALLGGCPYALGAWFWVPNDKIIFEGERFSSKDGEHPVILIGINGPNAVVLPRSSSVPVGISHKQHPQAHERGCRIKKDGYIKPTTRVVMHFCVLDQGRFSCYEPPSSRLRAKLKIPK